LNIYPRFKKEVTHWQKVKSIGLEMSINTAHTENGVLIHSGEMILHFSNDVVMNFSGGENVAALNSGDKKGRLYLTTHRVIFNTKKEDLLKSVSLPFVALRNVELEQPIFGANYIKGNLLAQHNGGFQGEMKFKLYFQSGGAIDFGKYMLKAAQKASINYCQNAPPPYFASTRPYYAALPPSYTANPQNLMGWNTEINLSEQPPTNSVFMTDAPPPYPGIIETPCYPNQAASSPTCGPWIQPQESGRMPAPGINEATSSVDTIATSPSSSRRAQNAYHGYSNRQTFYIAQPGADELPPSYDEITKNNN
jgi:hypothetical protein